MANKKISELTALTSVASADYIAIVDASTGVTKKATVNLLPDTDTVYTHPTGAGDKHIPTGGSTGQFLKYDSSGTAVWAADNDTVYTHPSSDGSLHVPATSTTNNGKILTAGSTAGSFSWQDAGAGGTLTTKGDLEVFGTAQTRLGVGTDNYVLTADSAATNGVSWKASAAGSGGNTTTELLYEHAHTISSTYSITSGNNAMTAGPITVSSGGSVTVPTGSTWTIV